MVSTTVLHGGVMQLWIRKQSKKNIILTCLLILCVTGMTTGVNAERTIAYDANGLPYIAGDNHRKIQFRRSCNAYGWIWVWKWAASRPMQIYGGSSRCRWGENGYTWCRGYSLEAVQWRDLHIMFSQKSLIGAWYDLRFPSLDGLPILWKEIVSNISQKLTRSFLLRLPAQNFIKTHIWTHIW